MILRLKWLAIGFVLACLVPPIAFYTLSMFDQNYQQIFREQALSNSAKKIKITSFHLAWGIEHDERQTDKDSFALEYVSSDAHKDELAIDQETLEVFELIRPISEHWGFKKASVSAFPTTQRKGKYHIYNFTQNPDGTWTYDRQLAKVFIND